MDAREEANLGGYTWVNQEGIATQLLVVLVADLRSIATIDADTISNTNRRLKGSSCKKLDW